MVPSISENVPAGSWHLALPTAQEIDAGDDTLSCALEAKADRSAAVAIVLASFVQRRNEMITCGMEPDGGNLGGASKSEERMNLTEEQVTAAAKQLYGYMENAVSVLDNPDHALRWSAVGNQGHYRHMVRIIAPHVQVPAAPPAEDALATPKGIQLLASYIAQYVGRGRPLAEAVERFAGDRHDRRRQRIMITLMDVMDPAEAVAITDSILADLDAKLD